MLPLDVHLVADEGCPSDAPEHPERFAESEVGEMVNYYKSPSPQEMRYRDVLAAIRALGPVAKELADELDEAVWQIVNRAVDAAIADREGRMTRGITSPRSSELAGSELGSRADRDSLR